jgi:ABC-type uncharacterized transport system involved in gliding motility auxiliary subunit
VKAWLRVTNRTILSVAVIGIFVLLTIVLSSKLSLQYDFTQNKQFTLSEQTIKTLKDLKQPIQFKLFANSSGKETRQATNLLREYKKRNKLVTYEVIDPEQKPTIANEYQIKEFGTTVVQSGDKQERIEASDIGEYSPDGSKYSFKGEQRFTQAILNIINQNKTKIYFVTGHEELPSSEMTQFRADLEKEGYELAETNVLREGKVPADADVLAILSPLKDITTEEAKLIEQYLKNKGKLLLALGITDQMNNMKNIDALLGKLGIIPQKVLALESQQSAMSDPGVLIPFYESHPITDPLLASNATTVFPGSIGFKVNEKIKDFKARLMLRTSDDSYGKKNLEILNQSGVTLNDLAKTNDDLNGPINLAYAIEDQNGKSTAVVLGTSYFLMEQYYSLPGNSDFTLNTFGWLSENKNAVTIRPKDESFQRVVIEPGAARSIFFGTVVGIPLVLLIIGGILWWRRKSA